MNETTGEIGTINMYDDNSERIAVLMNLPKDVLKIVPMKDMGWKNDGQGDRPKEFDEWIKELAEGLLKLITALIAAIGDFIAGLIEAAIEAGLKFAEMIAKAVMALIEAIVKAAILALIYAIYAFFIAAITLLFGTLYPGVILIQEIYGGSITLDGFNLEYLTESLKIVILLQSFWIFNSFLDIDVPNSIFSIKINDISIIRIGTDVTHSLIDMKYYDSLKSYFLLNNRGNQLSYHNEYTEFKFPHHEKQKGITTGQVRNFSEPNVTFGYIYDYDYWENDIKPRSLWDELKEGRDKTEDYLDKNYDVSTFYNNYCTDYKLLKV
ncbi:MAG: hypothetical protein ACTSPD_17730 [Promethearchaeota archaeon]